MRSIQLHPSARKAICLGAAVALATVTGCSSVGPSKPVKTAGTGAVIGGLTGLAVGNNTSMGGGTGLAAGAAGGALIGGIVGLVQDRRDQKEQDRLAQERQFQQESARKKSEEAKLKAAMDEELEIAQGFRISDIELDDAHRKLEIAQEKLRKLEEEKAAARKRKKDLDETREKTLVTEAGIAKLEEELARLKNELPGEFAEKKPEGNSPTTNAAPANAPGSPGSPSAAVKPGT